MNDNYLLVQQHIQGKNSSVPSFFCVCSSMWAMNWSRPSNQNYVLSRVPLKTIPSTNSYAGHLGPNLKRPCWLNAFHQKPNHMRFFTKNNPYLPGPHAKVSDSSLDEALIFKISATSHGRKYNLRSSRFHEPLSLSNSITKRMRHLPWGETGLQENRCGI